MSPRLLSFIVFIEGFCSLGAEVLALRQLIPHTGSSIVVTAPTIGLFLLALALGYHAGARVATDFVPTVARNFLIAAFIAAIGLAGNTVDALFTHLPPAPLAYLVFTGGVLCPLAWLLGQTVPILTNLLRCPRTGEASGTALYHSTLGSFLGSVTLSLVVMQWAGVSAAVLLVAGLLFAGYLALAGLSARRVALCGAGLAVLLLANQRLWVAGETAYANYAVRPVEVPGMQSAQAFVVNNSISSLRDASEPPRHARYIERIRRLLVEDLAFRERDILVLGAGGFTLSEGDAANRYTYVDIDPSIRRLAEQHFLGAPARGTFVADDARNFVRHAGTRYAAVVVDVFTARTAIPAHLVTREFWAATRRIVADDGVLVVNLILDPALATPYARNLLASIETAWGRCAREVLQRRQALANVVVVCTPGGDTAPAEPYTDERNRADLDVLRER